MFFRFFNSFAVMITLSTMTGILLHDMRLDKAAITALSLPPAISSYETGGKVVNLQSDPHTHTERMSLSQALGNLNAQQPRVQPRGSEDKKHLLPKHVRRGVYPFDGYRLPLN